MQVHKVPAGFWSEKVGQKIGNKLGDFIESNPNNFTGIRREFIRIRVNVNINKPLKSSLNLKAGGGNGHEVVLCYERLPTFCFQCGLIGHEEHFCRKNYKEVDSVAPQKFGPKMRAFTRRNYQLSLGHNG